MVKAILKAIRGQNHSDVAFDRFPRFVKLKCSVVQCGGCGQRLGMVEHYPDGSAQLMEEYTHGWRYDAEHETWRPTETAAKQYLAARDRIRMIRRQSEDRDLVRGAHGLDGRLLPRYRVGDASDFDAKSRDEEESRRASREIRRLRSKAELSKRNWIEGENLQWALDLPTKIACVQCGKTNAVDVDLHDA